MVFVLDKHKKPLMPCTEKRARLLLTRKRAVVHKMFPFTIRLKDRTVAQSVLQPLHLKFDPGSKTTGMAVLRGNESDPTEAEAILLGEIRHKPGIKHKLDKRRTVRRSRRARKTRYRKPRFLNRKREKGWLPPSLDARVAQTMSAVNKLLKLLPITSISTEHIKFDTQLIQNPNISGVEYQQGTLAGYEVREYLLEKWARKCAYCQATNVPLQIEHIQPKSRGGTDRISNLTIACHTCNQKKGTRTAAEFGFAGVQDQAKKPLKDAAMLNATRWELYTRLKETGLPVECGTGARTKMRRIRAGFPKSHYYDACCVGAGTPGALVIAQKYISVWTAVGRGSRKLCKTDKHGFPISHRSGKKNHFEFQTGDIVTATVPRGKYMGRHTGRVAARANGSFDIKDSAGKRIAQSVLHKHCRLLQRNSGWHYEKVKAA